MSVFSARVLTISLLAAACGMTACSKPAPSASAQRASYYWSAARETYANGDYAKTADHLEHLLDAPNQYTALAVPWYLVLTSGMANGYMELADQYAAGAHVNKAKAAAFRTKAADYRTIASQWAMRFAQNSEKLKDIPLGPLPIAFPLPKGGAAQPPQLKQIAGGMELSPEDAEAAEILTVQQAVLMAVCRGVGAPQNLAKAEEILAGDRAEVPRATFGNAVADALEAESALYARNRMDEPQKLAALRSRAEIARKEAARVGSARIIATVTPQNP